MIADANNDNDDRNILNVRLLLQKGIRLLNFQGKNILQGKMLFLKQCEQGLSQQVKYLRNTARSCQPFNSQGRFCPTQPGSSQAFLIVFYPRETPQLVALEGKG